MTAPTHYSINTDVKVAPLQLIDLKKLAGDCREQWFNQTVCRAHRCRVPGRGDPGSLAPGGQGPAA